MTLEHSGAQAFCFIPLLDVTVDAAAFGHFTAIQSLRQVKGHEARPLKHQYSGTGMDEVALPGSTYYCVFFFKVVVQIFYLNNLCPPVPCPPSPIPVGSQAWTVNKDG